MLTSIEMVVFWLGLAGIAYAYVGYPLVVLLISRLRPRPWQRADHFPSVSIVIAARNEEKDIGAKLENTLEIDYPAEKLEIIVASDFSTDRTDEIVRSFEHRGVRLLRPERRLGQTAVQNLGVEHASGEIVVFSDATTYYNRDVLRRMLPNFADEKVGCVAGKLIYEDGTGSSVGRGASNYWSYETFLKENESLADSLIGVSGCLYAVRRSAYRPMYPEACSDFLIATVVYRQGLRTVYEPSAVCTEETNVRGDQELKMRIRIVAQTLSDIWRNRDMLNPLRSGFFAVALVSHKLMRYAVPLLLAAIYAASAVLAFSSMFFAGVFATQTVFWAIAALGLLLERRNTDLGMFSFPAYFALANLASLLGLYKFLKGETYSHWEPSRDTI